MKPLHVEICNERLLPRFGVDRLLALLGRRLAESGHRVSFTSLRCDQEMLAEISSEISVVSVPQGLDIAATENRIQQAMTDRWHEHAPDVAVMGGWPFFQTAASASRFGVRSVFIDAGAVAQDGLGEPLLSIQRELRRVRQLTLPFVDSILPISDFIRRTQTEFDRGTDAGVQTVLLGGDHMTLGMFRASQPGQDDRALLMRLRAMAQAGNKLVLLLGRFEAGGYKNSVAAYEVLRAVRDKIPEARLLLLDAGADCKAPKDLRDAVVPLGAPDDETLQETMSMCSAGLSTSLWEGFNLPVAEMQWLDRPALAFNLGAHPEIIAHPWLLCEDMAEMSAKLGTLLGGQPPFDAASRFSDFRARFPWSRTLDAWEGEINRLAAGPQPMLELATEATRARRVVLVDVTSASLDPANPGVIRVVRRLCSELQWHPHLELVFAAWSAQTGNYVFLDETRRGLLGGYSGPHDGLGLLAGARPGANPGDMVALMNTGRTKTPVLLLPEVMVDDQAAARVHWGKERGFRLASILYDLIAIHHSELCDPAIGKAFPDYLRAIAECDAVWAISGFTLGQFRDFLAANDIAAAAKLEAIWLPGQFGSMARNAAGTGKNGNLVSILCVSTLEPRKGHLRLLKAYSSLRTKRPDLALRLSLIGNRYAAAPEIVDAVEDAKRHDNSIEWRGFVNDSDLAAEFNKASFTVYPSLVEGFGLPIMESLWMGRPCVIHEHGVMQELAAHGGCLTVDMQDPKSLMEGMETLATDETLRQRLCEEAKAREIATWHDYAQTIAARLVEV